MNPLAWWESLSPTARRVAAVVAVVVAANLTVAMVRSVTGGTPGGPTSSSYATGDDGMRALADLLAERGHAVARLRVPLDEADLDPSGTLVVADPDELSASEADAADAFVRAGGRLVAAGPRTNPALRRALGPDLDWSSAGVDAAHPVVPVAEVVGVEEVRGGGKGSWRHTGAGLPVLAGDGRVLAAVAAVERGRVIAIADASVLHNAWLGDAGNAAFALGIVGERGRPVLFAEEGHGYGRSPGFGALPSSWRWAAAIAALAGLAWMWSKGRRFGPPDEPTRELPPPRRAYADALGAALAKTREPAAAARPLQRAARRRVLARAGLPPDAADSDVVAAARRMGLDGDESAALTRTATADDDVLAAGRALAALEETRW
ncbi:MAG: DUF4350 domain-containing protein [Actinobacteria bacterium]|nr:DUF4350 domain-containing protein [Actinomycetota bacterium]